MKVKKAYTQMNQVKDYGFTLLEVLIAILILSIGLLGMASLTVGIIKGNKFSRSSEFKAESSKECTILTQGRGAAENWQRSEV